MICELINHTQYLVAYSGESFFASGHFEIPPTSTPPTPSPDAPTTTSFSVAAGPFTGVAGGAKFHLQVDGSDVPFALGFTSPLVGSNKAGVAQAVPGVPNSPTAMDGYNSASVEIVEVTIETASSKVFNIKAIPGAAARFEVTEIA